MAPAYALGFDIGGTFTDFVRLDLETGAVSVYKALTDAHDPARGVLEGLKAFMKHADWSLPQVDAAIHSTTLITNAIIERKGAPTALITTGGFRDILAMGREQMYDIYDLFAQFPEPLVPRHRRYGVSERLSRDGEVLQGLDLVQVREFLDTLWSQG